MRSHSSCIASLLILLLASHSTGHAQQAPSEIRDSAHRKYPDDPVAGSRAANAALEDRALGEKGSPKQLAAWVFLGYYTKNTSSIPQVCKATGVEIDSYASSFAREHKGLLELASKQVNVQEAIDKVSRGGLADATSELNRLAGSLKTDVKGACGFIQQNGHQLATGAHFAKILPRVHAQLVAE